MKRSIAIVCGALLASLLPCAGAATEARPDAQTVRTLKALGCNNIPEQGPRGMNCTTDEGNFLCAVFERLGKPLECSGAQTPAIRDIANLSDEHFLHADLPGIAKATPCAIWAYPEDNVLARSAGQHCARRILRTLHCTVQPDDAMTKPVAVTASSATCPAPSRATCALLSEAHLVDICVK